jgi:hypothetical protein
MMQSHTSKFDDYGNTEELNALKNAPKPLGKPVTTITNTRSVAGIIHLCNQLIGTVNGKLL